MSRSRPPGSPSARSPGPEPAPHVVSARRKLAVRFAATIRWLHIYLSMLGLAVLLFFGVTGLTLNHADWFGGAGRRAEAEGTVAPSWLGPGDPSRLEVVEHLRSAHKVRGALADFSVDDRECVVAFKGPGYSADAFIDRETGRYRLTETSHGLIAILNDLHKGRDTGPAWSLLIDASAVLTVVISLTGLVLLFYLKRRRIPGVVVGIVGALLAAGVVRLWVP